MARTPFPVEVLTPEGQVFAGEVEMLSTRTEVGEIGVLANHTPLLAMLQPADLRLHLSETEVKHFAQGEGYLQVHGNHALVLVEDCFDRSRSTGPSRRSACARRRRPRPARRRPIAAPEPAGAARQAPRRDVPAHRRRAPARVPPLVTRWRRPGPSSISFDVAGVRGGHWRLPAAQPHSPREHGEDDRLRLTDFAAARQPGTRGG